MLDLSNRLRLIIAAIILIPVLLYWGFTGSPGTHLNDKPSDTSKSMDYFVNHASVTEWSIDGTLKNTLNTNRLEHNPTLQQSHLTQPINYRYRDKQPPTRITSDTGITMDDNSRTDLAGNVLVNDNPESDNATIMTTQTLSVFPLKDYATSKDRVTISSPNGMQTGIGMHADFNTRTMTLHSRVEGRYDNKK